MINDIFKSVDKSDFGENGDNFDKLVNYYTVMIYILGAIFLSLSPFITGAFECTTPAQWKGSWTDYARQYCYLKNTYYIPMHENIEQYMESGDAFEIQYYQWIPYYLAFSCVLFIIPYIYWTSITKIAGIDLEFLVTEATKFDVSANVEDRQEKLSNLAGYIDLYLDNQEDVPGDKTIFEIISDNFKCCTNQKGTLMGNNYFFCKLVYMALICLQLYSLSKFLGMNILVYSFQFDTLYSMVDETFEWREKELFPLVTFCNFSKTMNHDNFEKTFLQCTMPNNIFNQRFFVFLCYWLVLLFALEVYSTLWWFNQLFLSFGREKFVKKLIGVTDQQLANEMDQDMLKDFVSWYLQADGIFVFQMINHNSSRVVGAEIMAKLWEHFNANYEEEKRHRNQRGKQSIFGQLKNRKNSYNLTDKND